MELMKFTNLIIKKGYEKGLNLDLELSVDDESHNEPSPQIQINIQNEHYASFALFYALADENISFSSIFEIEKVDQEMLKSVFAEDMGIFQSIIFEEDNNCVHLYTKINKEKLNEEYIDEILDFLLNQEAIKVVNYLK